MAIRTYDEIVTDLMTYILQSNEKADISPGQVLRDIVINAPAYVMQDLYSQIDSVRQAQTLQNASTMSIQDMDNMAFNYGIIRKDAVKSFGSVTFYTTTQPLVDMTIPAGTIVGTSSINGTTQINFITLSAVNFVAALESSYYNPNHNQGQWELTVNVQAQNGGTSGNVGPYTINSTVNSDLPFQVTNYSSINGGTDQESNTNLAIRVLNTFLGNNKGTRNGYYGTATSQDNVLDALVVGPGDPLMQRDGGLGGKVDIWVITSDIASTQLDSSTQPSLTFDWNNAAQSLNGYKFVFPVLPLDINSPVVISGTTYPSNPLNGVLLYEKNNPAPSGLAYVNAGEYHYTLYSSNDLDTAHSVQANDYIYWNNITMENLRTYPSGLNTQNGLTVDITYSYNQAIDDLQTTLNSDSNKILTADVLAKVANEILVDVYCNVNLLPNYQVTPNTQQQTINNINQAVVNFIDTMKMGTKLEKSDLVQIIHEVPGVDNVVLNTVQITKRYQPIYNIPNQTVENIYPASNEYLVAGVINVVAV